jgi:UDP-glucose 4,6-dehydratase
MTCGKLHAYKIHTIGINMVVYNILLTGGAGFIGSHVVDELILAGHTVIVYDKVCYCASEKNVNPIATLIRKDILDLHSVLRALRQFHIHVIMHFAAETHVDNSFNNSVDFMRVNAMGTHVMLEATRQYGMIQKFIHVSTDEVYGSPLTEDQVFTEASSLLLPTNPYAASKAAAEMIAHAYKISYKLPIIVTRCNNVYGPRQFPEKIIPLFHKLASAEEPLTIHGNGLNKRAYLHVTDAARAFRLILDNGEIGSVYNIGSPDERTNLEVAAEINTHLNSGAGIVHVADRSFNDTRYPLALGRIFDMGWTPVVPWVSGLKATLDWYTANPTYW